MADTTQMGFSGGEQYNVNTNTGVATPANDQAVGGLGDLLTSSTGPGVASPLKYSGYIPTPAVVSSGNAAAAGQNSINQYNQIQDTLAGQAAAKAAAAATTNVPNGQTATSTTSNGTATNGTAGQTGSKGVVTTQTGTDANGQPIYSYSAADPNDANSVAIANLQNANAQYQSATVPLLNTIKSIASGTYVLTPAEQSQLDAIQQQINQDVETQTRINNMEYGSMNAWSGNAQRYGGGVATSYLSTLATNEAQKVSNIQAKGAALLAQTRQAILDGDMKAAKDAMDSYNQQRQQISDSIMNIQKIVSDQATQTMNQMRLLQDQQQQQQKQLQDARDFAYSNNISQPFYQIGNQVYNTATGQVVSQQDYVTAGGKGDMSDVQQIDPGSKAESDYVSALSKKYSDTVFPTMTAEQAQKAMQYSKIYQNEVRPPEWVVNGGGSGDKYKFSTEQSGRLLAQGFTNSQIAAIQTNLNNGYSIDEINKAFGFNDDQSKTMQDVLSGLTANQSANNQTIVKDGNWSSWIYQQYPWGDLDKAAKAAGYKNRTDYINNLVNRAQQYKNGGSSDGDIASSLYSTIDKALGK